MLDISYLLRSLKFPLLRAVSHFFEQLLLRSHLSPSMQNKTSTCPVFNNTVT